jgi:CheY-like chemotaxis protein
LLEEIGILLSQGTSRKRVLVVDEGVSTLKTLAEVLQTKGYSVVEAHNKEECIQKALAVKPDMIIVDDLLSDRYDIVRTLRFEKDLENVCFILLAEGKGEDAETPKLKKTLLVKERAESAASAESKKTILIVDDNLHIRELLRQELEALGYRVREAKDGREALAQVKEATTRSDHPGCDDADHGWVHSLPYPERR